MKLKAKFITSVLKTRRFFAFALVFLIIGGFLLPIGAVFARNVQEGAGCTGNRESSTGNYAPGGLYYDGARVCDLSSINVTTRTFVNSVEDNVIKANLNEPIKFDVSITLNLPQDLRISDNNEDKGKPDKGSDFIFFPNWLSANPSIAGFGASITAQDTTTFCGSVGTNSGYFKCDSNGSVLKVYDADGALLPPPEVTSNKLGKGLGSSSLDKDKISSTLTTVTAGTEVFRATYEISPSDFARLGISNVKDSNATSTGLNEIFVYPDIVMNFTASADDWSSLKAAMPIFIRLYKDKVAMDTDKAAATACQSNQDFGKTGIVTCVPGYSAQTGSGLDASGGGDPISGIIRTIVSVILGFIQEIIYAIFSFLVAPVIQAMLSIHVYKDTFVAVIYPGWIVIRNLCDMMFIVALIVIAMATLLRLDSYQYKHLLVQLIIAALLINFSLVIAQAVLGIADTVQAQFLPANVTVIKSLAGDLMVNNWRNAIVSNNIFQGSFSDIVTPFFYLAVSSGSFMVFCAIAAFLLIRIVALWILLMVSPVAYACGILPSTAHYREEWWKMFLKYAFFTPIMAFFLNMAAIMSNAYRTIPVLQQVNDAGVKASFGNSDIATFVFKVASNILLLVFLLAGLMVAEQFSIYGAKEVSGFAKKYGVMAPFGLAAMGLKAAGNRTLEYASDKANVELDPRVWKHEVGEYLKKRKKDRQLAREERSIHGVPTGSPRDILENYFNGKGVKRVWASRFGRRGFAKQMIKVKELEGKAGLLSDNDRTAIQSEIAADTSRLNILLNERSALTNGSDEARMKDAEINSLRSVKQSKEGKIAEDDSRRAEQGVTAWTDDQRDKAKGEYKKFQDLAETVERPQAYYARAARLEREAEEDKKISKIHDEGELNKLLRNARRQGDKPKAVAILKKLTRDRNLNEALEDEGLSTSYEDIIKFFEGWTDTKGVTHAGFAQDLHMNHHEMMQVATEVGYDAEESKQYNGARLTWIDPSTGELNWNGFKGHASDGGKQHSAHVLTEARKSEPRKRAGELPRWTYGDEVYDENLGRRVFKLNKVGMDLLLDYASPGQERWVREQFNTWSAAAAESDPEFETKLRQRAAERQIVPQKDPTKPATEPPVDYVGKVIENIHFVGKGEYGSKR